MHARWSISFRGATETSHMRDRLRNLDAENRPVDRPPSPVARRPASHAIERAGIDRRRFLLAGAGAAGSLFLAACDSLGPSWAKSSLKYAERKNESLER